MAIHLVRHAKAGNRSDWHQPDDLRPLTNGGAAQATAIAEALAPFEVDRVISSRYVRCVQTVQPLADRLGIPIEVEPALAEEASLAHTWALLEEAAASGRETVLCSHGNVIPPLLDRLHRRGIELLADDWSCRPGSIWTIELDPSGFTRAVQTLGR